MNRAECGIELEWYVKGHEDAEKKFDQLRAENIVLLEALQRAILLDNEGDITLVCAGALDEVPQTQKIQDMLEAAREWAYGTQDKPDEAWAVPLVRAIMEMEE